MFSCFGNKNKKVKVKSQIKNENKSNIENIEQKEEAKLEKEYMDLEIEKENLTLANKIHDKETQFLKELIEDLTITFNSLDNNNINETERNENNLKDFLIRENNLLKNKLEILNYDDHNTREQYLNIYDEISRIKNSKLKNNQFILENQLIEKQNELNYLILKLEQLKKKKKNSKEIIVDDVYLNNNIPEKIQKFLNESSDNENDEKENSNIDYNRKEKNELKKIITKDEERRLMQKEKGNLEEENNELIKKIYSEIIQYSKNIYKNNYNQAKNENQKYSFQKKKLHELQEEIENIKNPKKNNNINENENNNLNKELKDDKKNEEEKKIIKEKNELIEKNKSLIEDLKKKIEDVNNSKKEIQDEINNLYDTLNKKYKENEELEKKLKSLKEKK